MKSHYLTVSDLQRPIALLNRAGDRLLDLKFIRHTVPLQRPRVIGQRGRSLLPAGVTSRRQGRGQVLADDTERYRRELVLHKW